MAKKPAKTPKEPRPETKPTPLVSPEQKLILKRKLQFQELQLALQARVLKPVDFPFDPKIPEDVRALQVELMHRHLQRTITPEDFGFQNQAIRNLETILCPKLGPVINVTQHVTQQQINLSELKKQLPSLPEDEQIVLARGIKRIETSNKQS